MGQTQSRLASMSQPIGPPATAQSDATGNAVFTFPAPPTGSTWTGTLFCPGAPLSGQFAVTVGGSPWGEWAGNSIYGPIQALGNQVVIVTATQLAPNTNYLLSWLGSSDPDGATPAGVWPDPNISSVDSTISGLGIAGLTYGMKLVQGAPIAAGGTGGINPTTAPMNLAAGTPYQIWNLGWELDPASGTAPPTTGAVLWIFPSVAGPATAADNLAYTEGASNRLAGANVPAESIEIFNGFNVAIAPFMCWSLSIG